MKIAHFADLHFQNRPGNNPILADIIKCSNYAIEPIANERVDLIVIAGDLLGFYESPNGIPAGSPAHRAAVEFVYQCGMIAPVVLIKGTPSHDEDGLMTAFNRLMTAYPIYVTDIPEQISWDGERFLIPSKYGKIVISCLPSITKANLIAVAASIGSMEDTNREAADLMRDMFQAWGVVNEQARAAGIPTVFVGHGTVTGSQLSTGQTMVGRDLEFTRGDLELCKCDIYCLGHIHKAQSWGNIYYSGSITRLNHGETEIKSIYVHEIEGDSLHSKTIELPARAMKTRRPEGLPGIETVSDVQPGEFVRLVYTVSEEDIAKVDEAAIRQAALNLGAADVSIEKVIVPKSRVRAEGISQIHDISDKLARWGETVGQEIGEGVKAKLMMLDGEVEGITAGYENQITQKGENYV